jgi:putative methionine-R-sulfoxide reductase with GAF domain
VLIRRGAEILGQIDIDSDLENAFGSEDEAFLSRVAEGLSKGF